MKKVLFVHDGPIYVTSSGKYYGIHFTDLIRKRYLKLGDSVTFLMRVVKISEEESSGMSEISHENFSVIPVPNFKSIKLFFQNYFVAKRIIKEAVSNFDILVVRMPSAIAGEAIPIALELNKPLMAEFVGCTFDAYWNFNWKGKLIAHYKMWVQRKLIKKVPFVVYVTKEFLQKRYPSNAKQINCSNVVLANIQQQSLEKRLNKFKNYTNEPLKLGTIAALDVPYKGQADVIKAIARLKKQGLIFKYDLVGQGDSTYLQNCIEKENVSDLVTVIGPLKHDEVFEFLDGIDIYIQPSKQEGLPRALIEAMSRACPALGSRIAGIPELLDEDWLFTAGRIEEIESKLMKIDRQSLPVQAEINFNESKNYERELLETKRSDFYAQFLKTFSV